jgi:protein-disulfide isomerase/uncharacterized membrane protein
MDTKNYNEIKPFPILVYLAVVLFLIFGGIIVSGYLSISHFRVYTDINYSSFCAISKAINCDTVSQSPYSIFLGIPVPIWGIIGYIFMLITLLLSYDIQSKKILVYPTLIFISIIFSMISIFLGIISAVKIHSYCLMCIVTYGINFMILFMIWLTRQRFEKQSWRISIKADVIFWKALKFKAFKAYSPLIILMVAILIFLPNYWKLGDDSPKKSTLNSGITENGNPWIGAKSPELTIIEYADYMCFQCKKMHFFLRNLVAAYPDKIRLVHKQFPMDKRFNPLITKEVHPGAGILSSIAIYAMEENKFWELNDYLYNYNMKHKAIYLRQIARDNNLDLNAMKIKIHKPEIQQKLQKDIVSGLKNNVNGTPSYIINGQVYTGQIPPYILDKVKKSAQ